MKGKDLKRLKEIYGNIREIGWDLEHRCDLVKEPIKEMEKVGIELQKISREISNILLDYTATKNLRYQIRYNTRENKY